MQISQAASICASLQIKSTLPVYETTALHADGQTLTLIANNSQLAIRIQVQHPVKHPFKCCVESKKLAFALNAIEHPELSLVDKGLAIKGGRQRFLFPTLNHEDHPGMPDKPESQIEVDAVIMKEIRRVQYAAANNDVRYYLNGINLESNGNQVHATASDGHRLARFTLNYPTSPFRIILPTSAIKTFEKLELQKILIGSRSIYGIGDGIEVNSTLIDAKYPDISKSLQSNFADIQCSKKELTSALKSILIAKDNNAYVRLEMQWQDGMMTLNTLSKDGTDVNAEIPCQAPEPGKYVVNALYLNDMIQPADEALVIGFAGATSPMITRTGSETHLVMPMR